MIAFIYDFMRKRSTFSEVSDFVAEKLCFLVLRILLEYVWTSIDI